MPLRLSKPPDPNDPEYQSLERRVNLALHIGIYGAVVSGAWFVYFATYAHWTWLADASWWWLAVLGLHSAWVLLLEKLKQKEGTP